MGLEEKSSFKMPGLTFSCKLDWIISIAETTSKKIIALICPMKFHSPGVALYLYKSTMQPCMKYCCHVWLVLLVATCNCWISYKNKYAGLLVLRLLPLLNPWLIVEMWPAQVFSMGITLVDVLQNWLNWFHFLVLEVGLLVSDKLHDFSVTIPKYDKDVYVNSFFPRTARLWNPLPIECFPATYDLSGFKSRINRHLLTVGCF